MADQGSGGAFEISQRMTAMLGWGATVAFQDDWTWNQAAETYVLDEDMAEKLRSSNPQARPRAMSGFLNCMDAATCGSDMLRRCLFGALN